MFFRLQRLTPGYIRFLQTQAYQTAPLRAPAEKAMPRMAMLMGALGIGMCGYSSRQLALYHRPSARVLQWAGTQTDASVTGAVTQNTPSLDLTQRANVYQEIPPPSFAGLKVPLK